MTPQRIQLRRTKGWRKPEGAIVVARPSRWGNPYRVVQVDDVWPWQVRDHIGREIGHDGVLWGQFGARGDATARAVHLYRLDVEMWPAERVEAARLVLAGHDLACWCPLDQPCHADVLLELANGGPR